MEAQKLSDMLAGAKKSSTDNDSNDPRQCFLKGILALKANKTEEGISLLTLAANAGASDAKFYLATLLEDKSEAAKVYRQLAESTNLNVVYYEENKLRGLAQYYLAFAYFQGDGVEKSNDEFLKWITLAAENGNEDAIKTLDSIMEKMSKEDDKGNVPNEVLAESTLLEEAREHTSPELPRCSRIKRYRGTFIFRTLLVIILTTAIVLIRRMDQMSFQPIPEEEAMALAQEVKVTLPDQKIHVLDTHENLDLKTGTTVKVLGVYKQKLNKGNSPRVYWTNQYYLMELPNGTRGYGSLMETAIGQKTVLPEGDTAIITAVKKAKNKPTVQSTGKTSYFDYVYTLDGHKEAYALEDLHIYFPQRVAYLGEGLTEDKYIVNNDTLSENKKDFQKVKKIFLYDLRPITKKNGFFLFPKYQEWNEFLLQRWFRILLIFLAYVVEIILIFRILFNLGRIFKRMRGISRFSKNYKKAKLGDPSACYKVAEACESGLTFDGLKQSNRPQAMKWYKKAADLGYADAYARLGQIYEFGEFYCVDKDEIEAYKWYQKGLQTSAECKEGMDRIVQKRSCVYYYEQALAANAAKDYVTAFNALQKAVLDDNPDAQLLLGIYYNNGMGCKQNQAEAAKWIRKAAEQGNAKAQFTLGGMLSFGTGVRKDETEGLQWIKKAARQGYQEAINVLKSSNIPY